MEKFKVTYIGHSGFSVETPECLMLFDYYYGALPEQVEKPVYVFVSHNHGDHFSKEIFRWGERFPGTRYILSDDTVITATDRLRYGITEDTTARTNRVSWGESHTMECLSFETLRSTDQGVAFLIRTGGRTVYHAGDLHWWLWGDEDTPEDEEHMTALFKKDTAMLTGRHIDVAFLPLDPRQTEEQYPLGFDWYMTHAEIDTAFPMHFGQRYSIIKKFKALPLTAEYRDRIMDIEREGQEYEV